MESGTVGLDNEPDPGPEEIHSRVAEALLRLRQRKGGIRNQSQERPLELGLGDAEGGAVDDAP